MCCSQHSGEGGSLPQNPQSQPQPPSYSDEPRTGKKEQGSDTRGSKFRASSSHLQELGRHSPPTPRCGRRRASGILPSFFSLSYSATGTYLWKAEDALNTVYSRKDQDQQLYLAKTGTGKCTRFPVFMVIRESTLPCATKNTSTAARDSDGLNPKRILEPF